MDNSNLLIPLLQNASILLAMVVVYATASSHLSKRQGISLANSPGAQVLTGLLLGVMGIAIVMTPVEYVQNVILDTRSVLISLTALFFGPIPGLITMAVVSVYRISLGGATILTGLAVIIGSGVVGLAWRFFRKPDLRRMSWLELYLFGIAVHLVQVVFTFSLPDDLQMIVLRDTGVPIMLIFPVATVLLGKLLVRFGQEEALGLELQLASLVYRNSREAMMVTDADTRIIDVNPTFSRITGYAREEIIGKKPSLLRSGRHDAAFYSELWGALARQGHWAGEIWNRRKNGEIFPEWIEINAVYDETGKVRRWVSQSTDISEKKEAEEQIWRQANFDALTGLPNRSMFQDRLAHEIKHTRRSGKRLALLFLDLDRFKEVNDSLGHDMGDLLLVQVGSRLQQSVRECDTIARLGGDEFIIILNDLQDSAVVGGIAQKILDRLAAPFPLQGNNVYVSASLGITLYPDDGDNLEILLKNADQAMYAAKREGRNRYYYFTPSMQAQVNRRAQLTKDLRIALDQEQFHVLFQPVVALQDGTIRKAEALVRWNHPDEGPIRPDVFIPVAEEAALIAPLGNLVFRQALEVARHLCSVVPDFQLSVNKSPAQFDSRQDSWCEQLRASGLPGRSLVVEITEGLLLDTRAGVLKHLDALQEAGVQVALDDFGTGYSSLAYLKKFHISYLKIDQSFVQNLAEGNQDQALVEAMITMAHRLGLQVIAEGVETEAQCTLLKQAGCDYGQGYLFSQPVSAEALEALVRKQQ